MDHANQRKNVMDGCPLFRDALCALYLEVPFYRFIAFAFDD